VKPQEAQQRLSDMLVKAGIDVNTLDAAGTWQVFREFASVAIEADSGDSAVDAYTWECAIVNTRIDEAFVSTLSASFLRSMSWNGGARIEELFCSFNYEPSADFAEYEEEPEALDSWDFESLAEFFDAVQALPSYQKCLRHTPVRFYITQISLS